MKPKTKSELMAEWARQPDQLKREREVKAIRKAMDDARAVIQDGLTRYVKKKTKARSMAKAEADPFAELEGWESMEQIQDAYGYGEFTCDKIDKLVHVGTMMDINILTSDGWYKPEDALLQAACLTEETVKKYLQGRNGYGWHISNLKIYDKPRDLDEFSRFGFLGMGRSNCVCGNWRCENYEPSYHYMIPPTCKIDGCSICRPPQSWCYVEDSE